MASNNFFLENNGADDMEVYIEPHGHLFVLAKGGRVEISETYTKSSLTIAYSRGERMTVTLWEGDGVLTMTYRSIDVIQAIVAGGGIVRSIDLG